MTGFDLSPARQAAGELAKALDGFYAKVASGETKPNAANFVIQKLARILVPINFTREARFRHDQALTVPPLPTIAAAPNSTATPTALWDLR